VQLTACRSLRSTSERTAATAAIPAPFATEEKHSKSAADCGDFRRPVKAAFDGLIAQQRFSVGGFCKHELRYRLWQKKISISNDWPIICT
jgi:hypothetical protein